MEQRKRDMTILSQSKTKTAQQTKKIGSQWAHHIEQKEKNKQRTGATIITLSGELGSGKTTFTQGFLSYFGIEPQASSPTFTIIKHWKINRSSWVTDIYHADFYRLDNINEMKGIGWYEAIDNIGALLIVEWPERVPGVVQSATYKLSLAHTNNPTERVIREM